MEVHVSTPVPVPSHCVSGTVQMPPLELLELELLEVELPVLELPELELLELGLPELLELEAVELELVEPVLPPVSPDELDDAPLDVVEPFTGGRSPGTQLAALHVLTTPPHAKKIPKRFISARLLLAPARGRAPSPSETPLSQIRHVASASGITISGGPSS
jgi:hypothetical protein